MVKKLTLHRPKFKTAVSVGVAASTFLIGGLFNQVSANTDSAATARGLLAEYNNAEENTDAKEAAKQNLVNFMLQNGGENVVGHLDVSSMSADELQSVTQAFIEANQTEEQVVEEDLQEETEENTEEIEDEALEDESLEDEEELREELDEEELDEDEVEDEVAVEEPVEEEQVEQEVEEEVVEVEPEPEPEPELPEVEQVDPEAPALKSSERTHVVEAGETLNSIARLHDTTASKLASLNKLSNPNLLRVGQTLQVHNQNVESAASVSNKSNENANSTSTQPVVRTGNAFIDSISAEASQVADEHNLYASVMIAQAALETGYGNSSLSKPPHHNLFGIKGSYNGNSVNMSTKEDTSRGMITIIDGFRSYPNYSASFRDNADKLRNGLSWNSNFYSGTWKENTNSYRDATQWLTGRYATDRNYNRKLNSIIERYGLTRFDSGPVGSVPNNSGSNNSGQNPSNSNNGNPPKAEAPKLGQYTVKSGDTVYGISNRFGISMKQLRSKNGLTSNLIHPGQVLTVGSTSNTTPKPTTPSGNGTYTVKSGDTLYSISNRHNTSVSQLRSLNNISGNLIVPGQVLKLSQASTGNGQSGSSSQTPAQGTYTVKSGDTLYSISTRYNTSVSQLRSLNNISGNLITPGQVLKLSQASTGNSQSGSSSQTPAQGTYTVKSGDTLYSISTRYNTSVSQLRSLNNISGNLITPGQVLKLSQTSTGNSQSGSSTQTPAQGTYTVKSGDTLFRIAMNNNTTVPKLRAINGLSGDIITPGQVLRLSESTTQNNSTSTSPVANSANGTYTVKSGDTLYKIGQQFNLSVTELKAKNNLTSDLINVGQTLSVSNANAASTPAAQPTNSPSIPMTYTVKTGDTLSAISRRYNLTVNQLQSWNNLSNADLISPGQTLTLQLRTDKPTRPQATSNTHVVQKGDTLYSIASGANISVAQLKSLNNLNSDLIIVGQSLRLR